MNAAKKFSSMIKSKKNKLLNKTLNDDKLQELAYNLNDKLNNSKTKIIRLKNF